MKFFESARIEKLSALLLLVASVLLSIQAISAFTNLFEPRPPAGTTISVEGMGKVTAIPDVARINFTVSEDAANVSDAQEISAQKINSAVALLTSIGIDEKDVKTTSYVVFPKYSRSQPCFGGFCPDYEQTIIGYTVSQSIEVTVRDTAHAGDILSRLGDTGVSNLSGPNFTIDDSEALQADARKLAITDAKEKAKALAKDLGVRLVRVTGFWENTGGFPIYKTEAFGVGGDGGGRSVPALPTGENEVAVSVSITYEIR